MTFPGPSPLMQEVSRLQPELERISRAIHSNPELKFTEEHAAEVLASTLEGDGFEVERGVGGVATAFRASHSGASPGPTIALLAEYDALPGIGHGCGHNLIAAGAVTAARAIREAFPDHPGTLLVVGTPGEELGGAGKIVLAEAGVFSDVHAAAMFHPADRSLSQRHGLAAAHLQVNFKGIAAHAAKAPWDGRSALAAAGIFTHALDSMRQFVPPTARIHAILSDGGDAPNVVPASASVDLYVRDRSEASAMSIVQWVEEAAHGAAACTQTAASVMETGPVYADRLNNQVMVDLFAEHFRAQGHEIRGADKDEPAGSSDIGNLSKLMPVIHPYVQIADQGTPGHSEAMRAAALTERAHQMTGVAAGALAATVHRLLSDPAVMGKARAEFEQEITPAEA